MHILVVSLACRVPFGVPRALLTSKFPPPNLSGVQSVPDASHVPIAVSVRVWAEGRIANAVKLRAAATSLHCKRCSINPARASRQVVQDSFLVLVLCVYW